MVRGSRQANGERWVSTGVRWGLSMVRRSLLRGGKTCVGTRVCRGVGGGRGWGREGGKEACLSVLKHGFTEDRVMSESLGV
jgi:hypothetical protein